MEYANSHLPSMSRQGRYELAVPVMDNIVSWPISPLHRFAEGVPEMQKKRVDR